MSVRGGGMSQNEGVQERILSTRNDFRCLPSTLAPVFLFFCTCYEFVCGTSRCRLNISVKRDCTASKETYNVYI